MITWHNEKRKIGDLVPADYNPRQLTEKQAKDLNSSLTKFNLADPIIINADNKIIGGHQRLNIIKSKNAPAEYEVDVRVPSRQLTEDEEKELNIRLNKNLGEWDFDKLANFDEELLKEIGFDSKELDRVFQIDTTPEEDDVPDARPTTDIKLGDMFQLGGHRLLCGDSTKREDVERLMQGEKADMVFTDPPYGVSYADKNKFLNSIYWGNRIQIKIENDHKTVEDLAETVIFPSFCLIKDFLADKSSYYITAPQGGELLMMMMMMMQKSGLTLRHMLIWAKNNHVLGRTDYNYKHEPILFGWINRHEFYGNGEHQFSVWEIDKPHKSDLHPTMKPVSLIVNALQNSTAREGICMDLFLGSGSTLIACETTSRKCRGMEIDPKYCQVIIDRWEKFTGSKAVKLN
jgi:DNA modification methylase